MVEFGSPSLRTDRVHPTCQPVPMEHFEGRIAVVTGGGTGMGRELARQLSAEGCHVAMCDVSAENMEETVGLCLADAPPAPGSPRSWPTCRRRHSCRRSATQSIAEHETRPHQPAVQQRRHRRWRQLRDRRARRVGAHVQRLLGRRLLRLPHVHAAAPGRRRPTS